LTVAYQWEAELVDQIASLHIPGARNAIRESHREVSRRLLVLDDDPTGSQAMHEVEAVMVLDIEVIARALATPGSTCFVLTNSRSLPDTEATSLARGLAAMALELEQRLGGTIEIVSRSDSTLRGHLLSEVNALVDVRGESSRRNYDGILLVPSYLEAGRFTAANIHWARFGDSVIAVGETEFAKDATFGFSNSDLRLLLEEKSKGAISPHDVHVISLSDIRQGGPDRIKEILLEVRDGKFVVVNSTNYDDLEIVVLGLLAAESEGRCFLFRTGPSFVQVLAGLDAIPPLTQAEVWPSGQPDGHGLIVVGSHVGITNRQVEVLEQRHDIERVVIEVDAILDPLRATQHIEQCVLTARRALVDRDVMLITSRALSTGHDANESLRIARDISASVVRIVDALLADSPTWVIAKGGITSHDVLLHALGIERAEIVGQLFAGFVSVLRPLEAKTKAIGLACVVFAGNVGDDASLADAVDVLCRRF